MDNLEFQARQSDINDEQNKNYEEDSHEVDLLKEKKSELNSKLNMGEDEEFLA